MNRHKTLFYGNARRRFLLAAALLSVLSCGGVFWYQQTYYWQFDSTRWKSANDTNRLWIKSRMVNDLVNSKQLDGKTRSQVVSLLGPPYPQEVSGWSMAYIVDVDIIDPVMLLIRLDERNRVQKYEVRSFP